MKQLVAAAIILLSALASTTPLTAGEPIGHDDATRAALYYAAQQWGSVAFVESQVFANPKTGVAEVYVFTLQTDGRGRTTPAEIRELVLENADLLHLSLQELSASKSADDSGALIAQIAQHRRARFAADRFATVAIGANTDQPPLIYLHAGLPEHIAHADEFNSTAAASLDGATSLNVEYLYAGPLALVYRFTASSGRTVDLTSDMTELVIAEERHDGTEQQRVPTVSDLQRHAHKWEELLALEQVRSIDLNATTKDLGAPKRVTNVISGVPDYDQRLYGVNTCGPTAVAQVMGYWDGHAYAATGDGPFRNLMDGGPASESTNLAGVSAAVEQLKQTLGWNTDGVLYLNVTDGILDFANHSNYQNNLSFTVPGGIDLYPSWDTVRSEIDAGRPFLYEILGSFEYAGGRPGNINHFMTGVGYQEGYGADEDMQVLITHFNWGYDTPVYINFGNFWMWDNLWPIVPGGEDTENPDCYVNGPDVQDSYSGNVVINVTAGDESGIAAYEWQYLAPPNPNWQPITRIAPWYEGAGILDTVEEGLGLDPHESEYIRVRARAQDNWDRWCEWVELDRDLLIDNTTPSVHAPSITITEPFNHTYSNECFILWEDEDEDSNAEIHFYYDNDTTGFNGTLINFEPVYEDGDDSYVWDTAAIAEGIYWIWAQINDGTNDSRSYSPGYVEIRHERQWAALEFVAYEFTTADGDIYPETGEEVAMRVRVRNSTTSGIYNVEATVASSEVQVVMLDGVHSFGSFDAGQSRNSGAFDWVSKEEFSGAVDFTMNLNFTDGNGMPYYQAIPLPPVEVFSGQVGPAFRVIAESTTYEDAGRNCDNDGTLESGERDVIYNIRLENYGTAPATGIEVAVSRTAPAGIELGDVTVDYPDLNAGQSAYAIADDDLVVDVARSFSGTANLEMVITYNDGLTVIVPFKLDIAAAPWIDLEPEFINYGQLPPGLVSATATVRNLGTAPLTISGYGESSPPIAVMPAPPVVIEPLSETSLTISYDGTNHLGAWSGSLTLTSDSHQNGSLVLPLSAVIAYPPSPYGSLQLATILDNDNGGAVFAKGIASMVAGNFDLDPEMEIAVVSEAATYQDVYHPSALAVWDRVGLAWERVYVDTAPGNVAIIKNIVAADFDGDGREEIAVAASSKADEGISNGGVYVYDYSAGSYSIATTIRSNSGAKDGLAVGDRDKDGNLELVFFEKNDYNASIYARVYEFERTSGLSFTQRWVSPDIVEFDHPDDPVSFVSGLTIADSDGDGTNEILFMASTGILRAYEGDSHTLMLSLHEDSFGFEDRWDADDRCNLTIADSDADGRPEIIIVSEDSDRLYVIESTGNNSYNLESPFIVEGLENRNVVLVDDMNANGSLEIITLGDDLNATQHIEIFEHFADNSYARAYSSSTDVVNKEILAAAIIDILNGKSATRELVLGWEYDTIPILTLEDPGFDLGFVGEQISVSGPFVEGSALTLSVPVVNLGGEDAESVLAHAYAGAPAVLVDEVTVPLLRAGQSETVAFEWTPTAAGSYALSIIVDPENVLDEIDESNNEIARAAEIIDDDQVGPVITLVAIRDNGDLVDPIESDEPLQAIFLVEDPALVCSVTASIDGGVDRPMSPVDGRWEMQIPPLPVGDHGILVTATDCDNSPETSELSASFTVALAENCPTVVAPIELDPFPEDTTNSAIDITTVFEDGDGDELQYRVTRSAHINARLDGNMVILEPAANWHGSETVILYASDEPVQAAAIAAGARDGP